VLQVRLGLRPLERMRTAMARVRAGHAAEVPLDVPSELRPFAAELNTLLRQNAEGLQRARGHVANLAHGLKTPLARLALALERHGVDRDGELQAMVDDIDHRMRHHLRRARAAALAEGPARTSTEVVARIEDLALVLHRIHAGRAVAFHVAEPDRASVACEREDVDEMLGNLLDNAFKWAASRVTARVRKAGREVVVTIEDDGPGLPADVLPEAILPGRRLDETVPGDGFGLSITRELAELYGGALTLARSPVGGLLATVTLPGTPDSS
jgi:signal transduction histidine kinase